MTRPLIGAVLGVATGLAAAVVLQQQGLWPLDQVTVFLLPAATGLLGTFLVTFGRSGQSRLAIVLILVVLVPTAVWGAIGLTDAGEVGRLDGGCLVAASSDIDETTVTDTSRQNPFEIDPDGGLSWLADSSPSVFRDYEWRIYVVIGGVEITLDEGSEANTAGSVVNGGDVTDIRAYAASHGIDLDSLTGIHEVGGQAGDCSGFGFVWVVGDRMTTIAITALIIAVVLLIILLFLAFSGPDNPLTAGASAPSPTTPTQEEAD